MNSQIMKMCERQADEPARPIPIGLCRRTPSTDMVPHARAGAKASRAHSEKRCTKKRNGTSSGVGGHLGRSSLDCLYTANEFACSVDLVSAFYTKTPRNGP